MKYQPLRFTKLRYAIHLLLTHFPCLSDRDRRVVILLNSCTMAAKNQITSLVICAGPPPPPIKTTQKQKICIINRLHWYL